MTKQYEATATLTLRPPDLGNGNSLLFYQTLDPIIQIYATGAETQTTQALAARAMRGKLAAISVHTYQGSPIMRIVARGPDPLNVQRSAQAVTEALIQRTQGGDVGVRGLDLTEIDKPTLPDASAPVFPNTKLTLAVAALLGLGLGVGIALLWEVEGRRVRTRSDLAEAAKVPVFAELAEQRDLQRADWLVALTREAEFRTVTEALRDLRTNLIFASGEYGTIAMTSPEGQHGKTTVSIGLAATIARTGVRTILVDADLHRGRVADVFGVERMPGLFEVLLGAPLSTVVRRTQIENLDLITSGLAIADPGELLSARLPELLEQLEHDYDAVIIDTTPLVSVNDARIIARRARSVVLVVRADRTSQRAVRDAVERLQMISVKLTAAVLNRSRNRVSSGYYGPDKASLSTSDVQKRSRTRPSDSQ
jgi:capsular exopolysaccharide synthesis family protein